MITFDQLAVKIIQEQELVIGPLAWSEARKVQGLQVLNSGRPQIKFIDGNGSVVVDRLVARYERLFGRASHEVCREAVAGLIAEMPPTEIPVSLR